MKPDAATAWRTALAGCLALAAAMGIGRFVYTPILPHMIGGGAIDTRAAGEIAGVNFAAYLIGALIAALAWFAPRRREWFFVALVASAATTLAMAATGSCGAFLAIRLVSGLASAFVLVFASAVVLARLQEFHRPGLSAVHFAGVGAGIALSAAIVSLLAAQGAPWRQMWLVTGLVASACLAMAWLLLPAGRAESIAQTAAHKSSRFPASLWILIASYGFFGFGYVITATFINTIAKNEPSMAAVEPWVWLVVGLAALPSVGVWNHITRRTGLAGAYVAACLIEALGIAVLYLWRTPSAALWSAFLLGATFMAITALGLIKARGLAGAAAGRAIALMTAAFGFGQMTGPVVAGYVFDYSGSFNAALLAAIAALILSAVLMVSAKRLKTA